MNQELSRIDAALKRKQKEADETKIAAIEKLKSKKRELLKSHQYIKQMKRTLNTIKNGNRLMDQLYD